MPIREAKEIQKDLKNNIIWPVYWIYGTESMKVRELKKRIHSTINPKELNIEKCDASQISPSEVADRARTLSFVSGCRWIEITQAHLWKDINGLETLFHEARPKEKMEWICIFTAKDLDKRKKTTKRLTEKAVVIPCESVPEHEREAWINYLSEKRNLSLNQDQVWNLCALDPWSLDILDQELEKIDLSKGGFHNKRSVHSFNVDQWLHSFFIGKKADCLKHLPEFVRQPEVSIPFVGLIAWNLRQITLIQSKSNIKVSPYIQHRFQKYVSKWNLEKTKKAQSELLEMDRKLKQTHHDPLGLWTNWVIRCTSYITS